jgi:hypothetical protein
MTKLNADDLRYARFIVRRVCHLAGQITCIDDLRHEAIDRGLVAAVEEHDTAIIYNWLMDMLSHQGISDAVADSYIGQHGNVTWIDIARALSAEPACEKLQGYWAFSRCLYNKSSQTCTEPKHFVPCPLPRHQLRNGRLNQTGYSLFLFIRDVAGGDIVGWIDQQLAGVDGRSLAEARASLLEPLRHIYGISDKVIAMALATLLMGAGSDRPRWFDVGASFIVVDTLVHNFLARTGIIHRLGADHAYGPGCYRSRGCVEVLDTIAASIDARRFNPTFPKRFPRFIQHAIWRYCAQSCLDTCNGNQIDDRARCQTMWCRLYDRCDRRALRHATKKPFKIAI